MKTTRYFQEQVRPRRPYIDMAGCQAALTSPVSRITQPDGRIRFWLRVDATADGVPRYPRVVTLEDGETIHNAVFDRDFREDIA